MAELLAKAGYKGEAKQALQVVLLFPSYADSYFGGAEDTSQLVSHIVDHAQEALRNL